MEENYKETLGDKLNKIGDHARWKFSDAKEWCNNHKAEIISLTPVLVSAAVELTKIAAKRGTINEERHLKDDYIYDRSMGHYWELRRKPKQSEQLMIDQRRREGEPLGGILQDMRLLK
jgi:hypothetical protein